MAIHDISQPRRSDHVRWRDHTGEHRAGAIETLDASPDRGWPRIAVVIPCFRVQAVIGDVIDRIGPEVASIVVVDDGCPEETGRHVVATCADPRVTVLRNEVNAGVGGAVVRGYRHALRAGAQIVVKLDGDGQADPGQLPRLIDPILAHRADYTKGNRFALPYQLLTQARREMPLGRLIGNSALSFLHKAVSGYWDVVDPTNGFTAIHRRALERIDLDQVARGYFFEQDMLFHLGMIRAVVKDVPMPTRYGGESSSLRIAHVLRTFPHQMLRRFVQRVFYQYLVTDFNIASVQFLAAAPMLLWGFLFGAYRWSLGAHGPANTAGTVMLSALPIMLGWQLLLSAIAFDVGRVPTVPICREEG
jgi:glycosyltransferase involved in cell wall biosynthesis